MSQGQGGGRKTILNRDLIERIGVLLRKGNYIETTCNLVGISTEVFKKWMKEGHKAQRSTNLKAKFVQVVNKNLAEAETSIVEKVAAAIEKGDIKAGFDFLQRRWPLNWSKRRIVTNTAELPLDDDGRPDIAAIPTKNLEEVRRLLTVQTSEEESEDKVEVSINHDSISED